MVDEPTEAQVADYLANLVGEGKKYATLDDLAKAHVHQDSFINTLKSENQTFREELSTRQAAEQLFAQLQKKDEPTMQTPVEAPQTPPASGQAPQQDDLQRLVREQIEATKNEERVQTNIQQVADKLVEIYGDETKANEIVKAKATELGVSVKFLQDIATQSPRAFFAQLGVDVQAQATPGVSKGNVNPDSLGQGVAREGTYSYYRKMAKEDPKTYRLPGTQQQMMKDATKFGPGWTET